MPMYNLIEYSDNYSKTSGSLWQYRKDIPAVNDDGAVADYNGANTTDSFNFKTKITGQTAANNNNGNIAGRVDVVVVIIIIIILLSLTLFLSSSWFRFDCI